MGKWLGNKGLFGHLTISDGHPCTGTFETLYQEQAAVAQSFQGHLVILFAPTFHFLH